MFSCTSSIKETSCDHFGEKKKTIIYKLNPDKRGLMLYYDSTTKYLFFILNEGMFCLKFEQKYFRSPTFLPYILGLICMFEKCQKDSALVSLMWYLYSTSWRLCLASLFLLFRFPRLKRLNTSSPLHVLVVKVRWVHGTSSRWFVFLKSVEVYFFF